MEMSINNFWGDHVSGRIIELTDIIWEDNSEICIRELPLQENGKYGSPQLLLSEKPSDDCLEKLREMYRIRFFKNDDVNDDYKYLMTVETLRFSFEEDWHWNGVRNDKIQSLSKEILNNQWDFDGYFYITDELNSYRKLAVIPFKQSTDLDSGFNLERSQALTLVKNIVKKLNDGEFIV